MSTSSFRFCSPPFLGLIALLIVLGTVIDLLLGVWRPASLAARRMSEEQAKVATNVALEGHSNDLPKLASASGSVDSSKSKIDHTESASRDWRWVARNQSTYGFPDSFDPDSCSIPRIIHQTWKTDQIDERFVRNVHSWLSMNPGWEYRMWSDKENRNLIKTRFPEYLEMWDALPKGIMRADLFRYFVLWEYGGLYADLDFEALQPMDELIDLVPKLQLNPDGSRSLSSGTPTDEAVARPDASAGLRSDVKCLIGLEPYEHAHILYTVERLICNAIMLSCPRHPLWKEVVSLAHQRFMEKNESLGLWSSKGVDDNEMGHTVLDVTGPMVLKSAVDNFFELERKGTEPWAKKVHGGAGGASFSAGENNGDGDSGGMIARGSSSLVQLAEPSVFYPEVDYSNGELRHNCQFVGIQCTKGLTADQCRRRLGTCNRTVSHEFKNVKPGKDSFAVHHWKHTWIGGQPKNDQCLNVDWHKVIEGSWPDEMKSCERQAKPNSNSTWHRLRWYFIQAGFVPPSHMRRDVCLLNDEVDPEAAARVKPTATEGCAKSINLVEISYGTGPRGVINVECFPLLHGGPDKVNLRVWNEDTFPYYEAAASKPGGLCKNMPKANLWVNFPMGAPDQLRSEYHLECGSKHRSRTWRATMDLCDINDKLEEGAVRMYCYMDSWQAGLGAVSYENGWDLWVCILGCLICGYMALRKMVAFDGYLWATPESDVLDVSLRCNCTLLWNSPKTQAQAVRFLPSNRVNELLCAAFFLALPYMVAAVVGLQPDLGLPTVPALVANALTALAIALALPPVPLALRVVLQGAVFMSYIWERWRSKPWEGTYFQQPHILGILLGGGNDIHAPATGAAFLFEWIGVASALVMTIAYPWKKAPQHSFYIVAVFLALGCAPLAMPIFAPTWQHRLFVIASFLRSAFAVMARHMHSSGVRNTRD